MPQPNTTGTLPGVGQAAPQLRYVKEDLSNTDLAALKGNVVVLLSVPSLDTGVCATETRTFNQKAAGFGAKVIVISMDLPFAMKRFCSTEGITNVEAASDFRFRDLSDKWGAAFAGDKLQGITARAVWVLDKEGVIRYHELTPELGSEPDYDAALNAAKGLL